MSVAQAVCLPLAAHDPETRIKLQTGDRRLNISNIQCYPSYRRKAGDSCILGRAALMSALVRAVGSGQTQEVMRGGRPPDHISQERGVVDPRRLSSGRISEPTFGF
uniref:Uncharacterized protein n=1 Tax=Knipowitschia caucasica TaxID=637954 RepID=A0AAV2LY55_KNICA